MLVTSIRAFAGACLAGQCWLGQVKGALQTLLLSKKMEWSGFSQFV